MYAAAMDCFLLLLLWLLWCVWFLLKGVICEVYQNCLIITKRGLSGSFGSFSSLAAQ